MSHPINLQEHPIPFFCLFAHCGAYLCWSLAASERRGAYHLWAAAGWLSVCLWHGKFLSEQMWPNSDGERGMGNDSLWPCLWLPDKLILYSDEQAQLWVQAALNYLWRLLHSTWFTALKLVTPVTVGRGTLVCNLKYYCFDAGRWTPEP